MFGNTERKERLSRLNAEIERLEAAQANLNPEDVDDRAAYDRINQLLESKYKERDKVKSFFEKIDPTAVAIGMGSLAIKGIFSVAFARREDKGPITSTPAKNWFQSIFRHDGRV